MKYRKKFFYADDIDICSIPNYNNKVKALKKLIAGWRALPDVRKNKDTAFIISTKIPKKHFIVMTKSMKVWLPPLIVGLLCLCSLAWGDEIDDLVPFIIQTESNNNPYAISEDGCVGLMQISQAVIDEYNQRYSSPELYYKKEELLDYCNNTKIGIWYLRRLKDHYLKENYTIERMLAGYNGGISHLRYHNYNVSKMPKETRDYVRKIMRLYRKVR